MVVDILDVEVGLRTVVGRTHIFVAEQLATRLCGLQVESVVADEAENLVVAVDAEVAKHLLCFDISRTTALVNDILYKIRI